MASVIMSDVQRPQQILSAVKDGPYVPSIEGRMHGFLGSGEAALACRIPSKQVNQVTVTSYVMHAGIRPSDISLGPWDSIAKKSKPHETAFRQSTV